MGKGKRNREKRSQPKNQPPPDSGDYRPDAFPIETLDSDKIVGPLGSPLDGWNFELIYRYAIQLLTGLNVNWAIMIDAYKWNEDGRSVRRRVERIDICDSEIHTHTFRQSDDPRDRAGRRTVHESISAGDEVRVSRAFDEHLALLSREWEARVRRWIDG